MAILISVFSLGYHGKTIDFEKYSSCHRTTVAHFLNKGKWDDTRLEDILNSHARTLGTTINETVQTVGY